MLYARKRTYSDNNSRNDTSRRKSYGSRNIDYIGSRKGKIIQKNFTTPWCTNDTSFVSQS